MARMASLARCQFVTSHSFAPNSLARLGGAPERRRPAPQPKSRLSLRASHGYAARKSVAIPNASFPLPARRPGDRSRSALAAAPPLCVRRISVVQLHRLD